MFYRSNFYGIMSPVYLVREGIPKFLFPDFYLTGATTAVSFISIHKKGGLNTHLVVELDERSPLDGYKCSFTYDLFSYILEVSKEGLVVLRLNVMTEGI